MDSWQQYRDNLKLRGLVWTLGHLVYESSLLRRLVSPIVNLFKPDWVMVGNNKMYLDKNDRVISADLLRRGVWEKYETELFKKHIKPGNIVLDIGANIGYHTLIAAELVGPSGKVYAFEPEPNNLRLLKKSVLANKYTNVVLVNKALSDKNGRIKLYLSNEDNRGDFRIYDSHDNRRSIKVDTITLDSFFKNQNPKVNVIKIDVQGAETLVLRGAAKTINSNKQLKLFTEFWPKALRQSGSSAIEYSNLLKKNDFTNYEIDSHHHRISPTTVQKLLAKYPESGPHNADLLCIKKSN